MDRKRVLIVEDNPLNRELLVQLLEPVCEVVEAENGLEAVEKAHQSSPDLILMDLSMPVLSGWDATVVLKRRPATQRIPIVAVSARTMDDEISRAQRAGVDDFVPLPLDESRLFAAIGRFLDLPLSSLAAERC
jgi:two-component system cell cycle response regulator DivK